MNSELLLLDSLGISDNDARIITSKLYSIIGKNKNNINDVINEFEKEMKKDDKYKTVISAYALSYLIITHINMEQKNIKESN